MSNLIYGLSSASAVMAAQYWGKGDKTAVERVLGIALKMALMVSVVFALAAALFPAQIMRIFTPDTALISEGEKYLRTVSASYVLGAFAQIYLSVMRSVERVIISTVVYSFGLVCNVTLNAILIFGMLGFPAMGVAGAALATLITRLLELLILQLAQEARNG
jgi:Na+-driven multidrug efflux pump